MPNPNQPASQGSKAAPNTQNKPVPATPIKPAKPVLPTHELNNNIPQEAAAKQPPLSAFDKFKDNARRTYQDVKNSPIGDIGRIAGGIIKVLSNATNSWQQASNKAAIGRARAGIPNNSINYWNFPGPHNKPESILDSVSNFIKELPGQSPEQNVGTYELNDVDKPPEEHNDEHHHNPLNPRGMGMIGQQRRVIKNPPPQAFRPRRGKPRGGFPKRKH